MKKIVSCGVLLCCILIISGCNSSDNKSISSNEKSTESSVSHDMDGTYSYTDEYTSIEVIIDGENALLTEDDDNYTGSVDFKEKKMQFETEDQTSFTYNYKLIGSKLIIESSDGDYTLDKTLNSENHSSNSKDSSKADSTKVKSSTDKYTHYVKNYVGRNASTCGSERLSGDIMDDYGAKAITIIFISKNGEQVNSENSKEYVVTDQSPEPNTEIKLTFDTDEDGMEYDNLVDTSTIEEIELTVKPVAND